MNRLRFLRAHRRPCRIIWGEHPIAECINWTISNYCILLKAIVRAKGKISRRETALDGSDSGECIPVAVGLSPGD